MEGALESDAFTKAVGRSGNIAGLTEDGFRRLNREVAAATGSTVGAAREIVSGLVASGQVGAGALGQVATAATAMAKAYDLSADAVVKDFAGMGNGVAKWAAEHNKSMNFITVEQYRYIRSLEEQGRVTEAQAFVAQKVIEAAGRVTNNLGTLERAWDGVKNMASRAWDAMLGVGRQQTTAEQVQELSDKLAERQARGPLNELTRKAWEKGNESLRQSIYLLQEKGRLEARSAAAQAAAAAANQAAIKKERELEGKPREIGYGILDPKADQKQRFLRSEIEGRAATEKFLQEQNEAAEKQRRQEDQDYRRRFEAAANFNQQLSEQTAMVNASLIADDEARGLAQLAIEKAALSSRIEAMGLYPEQAAALQGKAAEYILARERQLTEELKPEIDKRLELYADFNRYMKGQFDEFRQGFVDSGRDAFREFVRTGRLSADNVAQYIRSKLADAIFDQFLAKSFAGIGGSIFNFLFGGGGGGLSVSTTGSGITSGSVGLVDLGMGGGRAGGGAVRPWSVQPVNELGFEMLRTRGRDYLMMGNNWGKVTPAGETSQRVGSGKGATYIDASSNIGSVGAGVSRAELNAALRNNNAQMEKRFRRLTADGRI